MSQEPRFHVFIKLPFPRGDFVDPPNVEWNATRDNALWKILSQHSRSSEIDWNDLALRFEVPTSFLLRRSALLYERQLSSVREQMEKFGKQEADQLEAVTSNASHLEAPVPTVVSDTYPLTKEQTVRPRGTMSRNGSSNTVTQVAVASSQEPRLGTRRLSSRLEQQSAEDMRPSSARISSRQAFRPQIENSRQSSSSNSDSEQDAPMTKSQAFRRAAPRFSRARAAREGVIREGNKGSGDDDDDDDDDPEFLFGGEGDINRNPTSTLRQQQVIAKIPAQEVSSPSASSISSAAPVSNSSRGALQQPTGIPQSPQQRQMGRREGSEGTPSMGSSFSDLDDSSVTRSAMEEALASNMRRGGMASRMSSIGQALTSRRFQNIG